MDVVDRVLSLDTILDHVGNLLTLALLARFDLGAGDESVLSDGGCPLQLLNFKFNC